jgi:hypothetical protein
MALHNVPDAYRQRLIDLLHEHAARRQREAPQALQLFVNHACVGRVQCPKGEGIFQFRQGHRAIRSIEIRNETGLIIGSLLPRELGTTATVFRGKHYRLDLTVDNGPESGSLTLAHCRQGSLAERVRELAGHIIPSLESRVTTATRLSSRPGVWANVAIAAQLILAVAVLGFVYAGLYQNRDQSTQRTLSLVEQKLVTLAETERNVAQISRHLEQIGREQEQLRVQLSSVERKVIATSRAMDARMQATARRSAADGDNLRGQIQELLRAKQGLTTAMSMLERQVLPLLSKDPVSKAVAEPVKSEGSKPGELSLALPLPGPQVVEVKPTVSPFTFWVSFQDGTSEQTIDDFLQQIQGRRGAVNAGWYSVEVTLAQPHSPDQLFQTLQKTKIVKALTTSLKSSP